MPSKSKAQQRFFGMVDAYKKGEMKNASSKIKKAANGMSMSDVKDFAETKHKGLPEKVEENMNKTLIRLTEQDLHRIVKQSINKVLKEGVEFSSENPQEEWGYYQNKLQDEFDELGVMVLNKIPRNDPDRQVVERYIKMIQAHLHALEN